MEAEMKMALQPPRNLRAETCRLVIWGLVLAMLAWAWRGAEMKPMALVAVSYTHLRAHET